MNHSPAVPPIHPRGRILCLAATLVMMSLCFAPWSQWYLGPLCLAPFAAAVLWSAPTRAAWLSYYLLGALFFLINLYWLEPITGAGWAMLALFVGLYFLAFAWCLRRLTDRAWPATLALPLAWTATEYVRSVFLTGFPWFMLGTSLTPHVALIQFADLIGISGVTFMAAAFSGGLLDLLAAMRGGWTRPRAACVAAMLVAWAAAVGYGEFRLRQPAISTGPRVAVVQDNIKPGDISIAERRAAFQRHLQLSAQALQQQPLLIAWPESMSYCLLNAEFLAYPSSQFGPQGVALQQLSKEGDATFSAFCNDNRVALVMGSRTVSFPRGTAAPLFQNAAAYYRPGNGRVEPFYAKRHLVPFGEFVPFRDSWPWLHNLLLRGLTPFTENSLDDPGTAWTRYDLNGPDRAYKFATPICFEDVMPQPCREFVDPVGGKKSVDFLVSMSNDAWFLRPELDQHLQMTQMRAVENRISIARSVNSGMSGFVDSNGRLMQILPKYQAGFCVRDMPLDARVTFYDGLGRHFPLLVLLICAAALAARPSKGETMDGAN